MKSAELRMISVSELKPGDKEYEKIKNSIEEFGFADPLVVNADMTIIGGHQRLTVAMALGYTEVPCAVVDVDKVREKALNIALNKITGAWDENLLAELLEDIQSSDFDLGKTPALIRRKLNSFSMRCMTSRSKRTASMWRKN